MSKIFILILAIFTSNFLFGQHQNITTKIDSLLTAPTKKSFNGVVIISQNGQTIYSKTLGFSDIDKKTPLTQSDQFVIGSISKQITAVLVLQEFEKEHIQLNEPIHKYLPELTEKWADSVTVHQLLSHTHGITKLNKPLAFRPETQFSYSQIGYELLARIIEKTSGKSFADLSTELFNKCKMENTFHPALNKHKNLVNGYTEQSNGNLKIDSASLENYPAAGSFISTASDLVIWNNYLHTGQLIKDSTYKMMVTKQKNALRQHPIFGATTYGYGITVDNKDDILQLGQTGFAPGFVSMDFYYPSTKTSIVILSNVAWDTDAFKMTFYYPVQIQKIIKESGLVSKH